METFVKEHSVVREIWGRADTILFIFAGSAAEFALNKAVDWLYFTGRLPKDPLGRLFSTVNYARLIVFSDKEKADKVIDNMASIHKHVEQARGATIPDWAYRDVLFMLIDYSMRAFELLKRKLSIAEKEEVFDVFNRVGMRMGLTGLPASYEEWLHMRAQHLVQDLEKSALTDDLFLQYKKHLGNVRYKLLLEAQNLVVPERVRELLGFRPYSLLRPVVPVYKVSSLLHMEWIIKELLLPPAYKDQINALDRK